jgi:hypothetical protein
MRYNSLDIRLSQDGGGMEQADLKSVEDLKSYNQELAARKVEDNPAIQRMYVVKRITWVLLLAASFLAFYLMDKLSEALDLLK